MAADAVKDLATKMSTTSENAALLHEEQTEKLAAVEVKVREQLREAESELDKELESSNRAVDKQIEMQKQVVGTTGYAVYCTMHCVPQAVCPYCWGYHRLYYSGCHSLRYGGITGYGFPGLRVLDITYCMYVKDPPIPSL